MIIELSDEFEHLPDSEWRAYQRAIENLLGAHTAGWHIFSPSRKAGEAILTHLGLSDTQKAVLKHHILNKVAVLSGQARSASSTIVCYPECGGGKPNKGNQRIQVKLSSFSNLDACMPLRLLVENADTDGRYILTVSEILARELNYNCLVRCEVVAGGGDPIGNRFRDACNETRPTLCVYDSDIVAPQGSVGSTAKKIQRHIGKESVPLIKACMLSVREIENFIPLDLIGKVCQCHKEAQISIKVLQDVTDFQLKTGDSKDKLFLRYFDFKNGLKKSDIDELSGSQKAYLENIRHNIIENRRKHGAEQTENSGVIIIGFSQNILKNCLDYVLQNGATRREFLQSLKTSPFWNEICETIATVMSFGAGSRRLPFNV